MKWGNFTTEQKEGESWEEIREVWERGGGDKEFVSRAESFISRCSL